MFGYVTDEQFIKLKDRWDKVDLLDLDTRIIPSLIRLGKDPDIAPVWSCSGHNSIEQKIKKPNKKTVMNQSRYIIFAVREGHTRIFKNFDRYIKNLDYSDYIKACPKLTFLSLHYGVIDKNFELTTFSVWRVEVSFKLKVDLYKKERALSPNWLEGLWENLISTMLAE